MIIIDTPALLAWMAFVLLSWIAVYKIAVAIERIMQERHEATHTHPAQPLIPMQPRDASGRFVSRTQAMAELLRSELGKGA